MLPEPDAGSGVATTDATLDDAIAGLEGAGDMPLDGRTDVEPLDPRCRVVPARVAVGGCTEDVFTGGADIVVADEVAPGCVVNDGAVRGADVVVTAGVVTAGVVTAGVVTAGVVTAGVVTAGIVTAGIVTAGVVTGGIVTVGTVICGTDGTRPD